MATVTSFLYVDAPGHVHACMWNLFALTISGIILYHAAISISSKSIVWLFFRVVQMDVSHPFKLQNFHWSTDCIEFERWPSAKLVTWALQPLGISSHDIYLPNFPWWAFLLFPWHSLQSWFPDSSGSIYCKEVLGMDARFSRIDFPTSHFLLGQSFSNVFISRHT